jgi:propionyl-CoA synthetase
MKSYFSDFTELLYTSSDWAVRDPDGYFFILGRTDDVINVAGHRLGTREIEEAVSQHDSVAEVAVVGVQDELKGQEAVAFTVLKNPQEVDTPDKAAALETAIKAVVVKSLGPVARPKHVHFVNALPKTRSGKLLRRSIQALAEGRDPGDLTTLDDPASLEAVREAVQP